MSKVRVHELAKELDTNSKELIALLADYGFEAKNHMSTLEQVELDIIFETYTQKFDKKVEIPVFGKGAEIKVQEEKKEEKQEKMNQKRLKN